MVHFEHSYDKVTIARALWANVFSEDRFSNVNVNNNSFPLAIFLYLFRLYQSRDIVYCVLLHLLVPYNFLYFCNTPNIYSCRHHHHHRFDCTDVCIIIVCLLICNCIIGWCKRNVASIIIFFSHAFIYYNYAERCLFIFLDHTLCGLAYF